MTEAATFRKIEPIPLDGLDVGEVEGDTPMIEWWNPADLRVDERYQRSVSAASMALIQKIIARPSWARLKPPVCAMGPDGELYVIDGQHTAIACASHPGFEKIPVLVVGELDLEAQAFAFLGHNRDRLAMRPEQIFQAQVAAGDEDALTAVKVCQIAGARILRNPAARGEYKVGDIIAVNPLMALVKRRTAMQARQVIECCVRAGQAPVGRDAMIAVDDLLHHPEFQDRRGDHLDIAAAWMKARDGIAQKAGEIALTRRIPKARALAIAIYHRLQKKAAAT